MDDQEVELTDDIPTDEEVALQQGVDDSDPDDEEDDDGEEDDFDPEDE